MQILFKIIIGIEFQEMLFFNLKQIDPIILFEFVELMNTPYFSKECITITKDPHPISSKPTSS